MYPQEIPLLSAFLTPQPMQQIPSPGSYQTPYSSGYADNQQPQASPGWNPSVSPGLTIPTPSYPIQAMQDHPQARKVQEVEWTR